MIGRAAELKNLTNLYAKAGNQLVVLCGWKESGKEELLQEFCRGKKVMYYQTAAVSPKLQRQMMKEAVEKRYGITMSDDGYDTAFTRIRSGDGSKLVFVIRDFEQAARKDKGFLDSIGKLVDKRLYPGPVMVLLCTSDVAWAEHEMMEELGSCARKVTDTVKVTELNFVDVVHMFPEASVSQCVQIYGILGGVPEYLKGWDAGRGLKENICRHILSRDGYLYEEAEGFITRNLREPSVYNTILAAVAAGKYKLNDLFLETGYARAKISVYMKNLISLEVAEKLISFETGGWENSQKGLYHIRNTYLHFWYRFVFPRKSQLYVMGPEEFYDTYVAPQMEEYLNAYFRKVCREYLELMGKVRQLPMEIHKMGTWVGKRGNIDIIAQNSVRENLVGLCNWSRPQLTHEMYEGLLDAMGQARISAKQYYLFSARDFDEKLKEKAAEDDRIILVDMNNM